MSKIFKIDIDANKLLKCGTKDCPARRHKRCNLCTLCTQDHNRKNHPKTNPKGNAIALNTGNKVWSVYRIKLDGYVYYGQTGAQITYRAARHRSNALTGIHKNSYIHQQIVNLGMTGLDVYKLIEVLCIARTKEESFAVESHLIKKAVDRGEKVCNKQKLS